MHQPVPIAIGERIFEPSNSGEYQSNAGCARLAWRYWGIQCVPKIGTATQLNLLPKLKSTKIEIEPTICFEIVGKLYYSRT